MFRMLPISLPLSSKLSIRIFVSIIYAAASNPTTEKGDVDEMLPQLSPQISH